MASPASVPPHKALYAQFVDPAYQYVPDVNGQAIAKEFQTFVDALMDTIPNEGMPADSYMYSSHMGAFVRTLDQAKDHFVKTKLAFYAKRGSGANQ